MEIKEKLESTKEELHEKEGKMKDYASSAETCKSEIENMLVRNHFEKLFFFLFCVNHLFKFIIIKVFIKKYFFASNALFVQDRISKSGHQTHVLKNESELLSSLSVSDEGMSWVYKIFASYIDGEMNWSTALDKVLNQAGYDVSVTEKRKYFDFKKLIQMLLNLRFCYVPHGRT